MKFACCPLCGARIHKFDKGTNIGKCIFCNKDVEIQFTKDISAYYGYFIDRKELKRSSSGGAGTIIAETFIKNYPGGVVFGVRWKEDFSGAEYTFIDKISGLDALKGSKYVDVDRGILWKGVKKPVYHVVGEFLQKNMKVLFIGLGCDIFALKSYLLKYNISDEKLYTVDLLCGGTTSKKVMIQYTDWLKEKYKSSINEFYVRYKKVGWAPPYLKANFANGKTYTIPFFHSEFGHAFTHMKKEVCYQCKFKGANHTSDITIGDFWGVDRSMPTFNAWGMSSLLIHSSKGKTLLELIDRSRFIIGEADIENVLKGNSFFGGKGRSSKYQIYKRIFDESDIFMAAEGVLGRVKYILWKSKLMELRSALTHGNQFK